MYCPVYEIEHEAFDMVEVYIFIKLAPDEKYTPALVITMMYCPFPETATERAVPEPHG